MASTETTLQKKTTSELIVEISHLDREILYLEHHLLTLYRSAFKNKLSGIPVTAQSVSKASSCIERSLTIQKHNLLHPAAAAAADGISLISYTQMRNSPCNEPASSSSTNSCHSPVKNQRKNICTPISGHRTLADLLGTSIKDHIPETACKISEDIIRCVAAIYCKLTTRADQHIEMLPSSSSSYNSSSILSPENPCHSLSPTILYETVSNPCQIKLQRQKHDPYKDMIEVTDICMDDVRFEFASKMLQILRSLIGRLDAVDPRKMEQHEQLAFWINIHNALMMHAFLACEFRQSQTKKSSSVHRAAYRIGGHSVNIYCIQHLILGRSHPQHSSTQFSPLFSSTKKLRRVNRRHIYALHHPQPHAYFALCMGASSDPAVRIYTAKYVHQELKHAKEEYIQAKVCIQKGKIILPKILDYYAKDTSMEVPNLIETVSCSMQEDEQRAIQQCFQREGFKCLMFLPFETNFRFLLHIELSK